MLLEAKACPNKLDQDGETPGHATVRENSLSILLTVHDKFSIMDKNWVTFLRDFVIRGSKLTDII